MGFGYERVYCAFLNIFTASLPKPGLDTMEENADKSRFFAELEAGKSTPIDYSELNKRLTDTARSSTGR